MAAPGKLFLIPNFLSETHTDRQFPAFNAEAVRPIRHFIVENPKPARRLIKFLCPEVPQPELVLYHLDKHEAVHPLKEFLQHAIAGGETGLISDAGCPAVADPGSAVVAEAHAHGIRVMPLVGPSSVLLALMGSGFNGQAFRFAGYLPMEKHLRNSCLQEMQQRLQRFSETQIFIETPYRNRQLVEELKQQLPAETALCVATDLCGENEKIQVLKLKQWDAFRVPHKVPAIFLLGRG